MQAKSLGIEEERLGRHVSSEGIPQQQVVKTNAHAVGKLTGQSQAVRHEAHILEWKVVKWSENHKF